MDAQNFAQNAAHYMQDNNYFQRFTGSAAMSHYFECPVADQKWELIQLRVTLSSAGSTGTLSLTQSSATTAVCDHNFLSQDMTSVECLTYVPDTDLVFEAADKLWLQWANTAAITYGIEAHIRTIY